MKTVHIGTLSPTLNSYYISNIKVFTPFTIGIYLLCTLWWTENQRDIQPPELLLRQCHKWQYFCLTSTHVIEPSTLDTFWHLIHSATNTSSIPQPIENLKHKPSSSTTPVNIAKYCSLLSLDLFLVFALLESLVRFKKAYKILNQSNQYDTIR